MDWLGNIIGSNLCITYSFSSRKKYSQIEKEGLACVFGVKQFHLYLYGHSFTSATDHKPLLCLFGAKKPVLSQASGRI